MENTPPAPEKQGGALYWLIRNSRIRGAAFVRRHRKSFTLTFIITLILLLLLRAYLHPLVILFRSHIYFLTIGVPVAACLWLLLRKRNWQVQFAVVVGVVTLVAVLASLGAQPHQYLALYLRYRSLDKIELDELPTTAFDRIQPQNSIASLANEAMVETESPATPDYVRVGNDYRWTLAVEPSYAVRRLTGVVGQLFSVSGMAPSPNFSRDARIPVHFPTGEGLLLWNSSHVNVVRAFGLWRFLNYEPADVKFFTDDKGEWVQAVCLVRWKGWFFPRPEFGGVQIIRQSKSAGFTDGVQRALAGTGQWVPPGEIAEHPYLSGQNLVPYVVSRYLANSFRFQGGFLAPLPGYHLGDIRIPQLPDDVNQQPFTIYFNFGEAGGAKDQLCHYFALEPFHEEKQGLNTSLFIPADGTPLVYMYTHHKKSEALTGVSAIAAKVMESRKQYDWSRNRPVEHRPYIKDIDGKRRFFWLTTVVTLKQDKNAFIAGSTPDVVLTDASYKVVTWVNALAPDKWAEELEKQLGSVWKQ